MNSTLCITIRFLQPFCHARGERGEPEWPPSPLRLLQALVAGSAGRWNERASLSSAAHAIRWLESLPPPQIVSSPAVISSESYRLYVPDNVTDKLAASWSRGREASVADYRTEKDVRPVHLDDGVVNYLYPLPDSSTHLQSVIDVIAAAARSITHLGWGIDMAVGDASVLTAEQAARLRGVRWRPSPAGGTRLRVPKAGTLDDLIRKHANFLGRLSDVGFRPVPPLRVFDVVEYRRDDEPQRRPYRLFELRSPDGSWHRYPHRRMVHVAAMVRHLAIMAMRDKGWRPRDVADDDNWVELFVAGHNKTNHASASAAAQQREMVNDGICGTACIDPRLAAVARSNSGDTVKNSCGVDLLTDHRQLSYLPLPSIGHEHADPGVRRVMIAAPVGCDAWLDHIARRLAGKALEPLRGDEFAGREPPILVPFRGDGVTCRYTGECNVWHSFTPVILPGHDDHKPEKTRVLIQKALLQSGIDQPCEFEWSPFSRFSKAYSAHKYGRDGRPQGYIRPNYLHSQTAVHLTLHFDGDTRVSGPLAIGAGRHCGFGLMAHFAH